MGQETENLGEMVEHVDTDGTVIQIVERGRMRAERLRHRCTYVFVRRTSGDLVVHRRAEWKSIYPGWWDVAFGGVCGVGEAWEASAWRELGEEAGLAAADLVSGGLRDLGALRYDAEDGHIVGRAYLATSDAILTCPDGEVVAVDSVPIADLDAWLRGREIAADTLTAALPLALPHLAPT